MFVTKKSRLKSLLKSHVVSPIPSNGFFDPDNDRFFINDSGNNFTYADFSGNPPLMSKSRSVNSFDYDNDGDLDLIVTDFNLNVNLWENKSVDTYFSEKRMGSWVKIFLEGTVSNRDGMGSIIEINFSYFKGIGKIDTVVSLFDMMIGVDILKNAYEDSYDTAK
jgi:hypothetical protein